MPTKNQRSLPIVLFVVAAALIAGRVAVTFAKPEPAATGLVQWMDLEEGLLLARTSDKPILYDFTAEWCAPCHVLDAEVFRNPEIAAEINERFIPVRVTDRQREEGRNSPIVEDLQRRYSVRGFPTVIVAEGKGAERGRMEGFRGREEFQRLMESVR